jgi:hypothetical protein
MQTQANTASKTGDGVEITPEMIEAGFSVLSYHYYPDASDRDRRAVAREMYLAMRRCASRDPNI